MTYKKPQAGFSLIEVMVSIAILLIATVGPMTIAAQALKSAQYSREQNTAFFLAQEGIEAVILFRNEAGIAHVANPSSVASNAWASDSTISSCLVPDDGSPTEGCGLEFGNGSNPINSAETCTTANNNPCRLYFDDNAQRSRYTHSSAGSNELTQYTRQIYIDQVGTASGRFKITSDVRWQPVGNLPPQTVKLQTYIHDIYNTN